jgi:hypothetical protein
VNIYVHYAADCILFMVLLIHMYYIVEIDTIYLVACIRKIGNVSKNSPEYIDSDIFQLFYLAYPAKYNFKLSKLLGA